MLDDTEVNLIVKLPATHYEAITGHFVHSQGTELKISLSPDAEISIAYKAGFEDSSQALMLSLAGLKEAIVQLENFQNPSGYDYAKESMD